MSTCWVLVHIRKSGWTVERDGTITFLSFSSIVCEGVVLFFYNFTYPFFSLRYSALQELHLLKVWLFYTRLGATARRSLRSAGFDALGMKDFVLTANGLDECTLMFGCWHEK